MDKTKRHELIRAALFDYGCVLAEEGFRKGFESIAIQTGVDPAGLYHLALDTVFNSGYVIGRCREEEFWKIIFSERLRKDYKRFFIIIMTISSQSLKSSYPAA